MATGLGWETVRAAQRAADVRGLADAGAVRLVAALHLTERMGPYIVGEHVVRERLRAALHHARGAHAAPHGSDRLRVVS